MKTKPLLLPAVRWCGSCCTSFACWTLWLALTVLFAGLVWVAVQRQLPVPDFLLRRFEQRLAAAGVTARFGQVLVDPGGRIVLTGLRLNVAASDEPIVESQAVLLQLDRRRLFMGEASVQEIRITGTSLQLPAMLSPSGATEVVAGDIDAVLTRQVKAWRIDRLSCRIENLLVMLHGTVPDAPRTGAGEKPAGHAVEGLTAAYLKYAREIALQLPQLRRLENPRLTMEITPGEKNRLRAGLRLFADRLRINERIEAEGISLSAEDAPGAPQAPSVAQWRARSITWAGAGRAVHARGRFSFYYDADARKPGLWNAEATAGAVEFRSLPARAVSVVIPRRFEPLTAGLRSLPIQAGFYLLDSPVRVQGTIGTAERTAVMDVEAAVTPALLDTAMRLFRPAAAGLVRLDDPAGIRARLELGPGWKPARAEADIAAGAATVRGVPIDAVGAHVEYTGTGLSATDLVLHQGDNVARGSYTMDTATLDYRFLLQGRLRPPGISGWFKDWWPRFWDDFDFSAQPPEADIDVQGRWREPELSNVFCGVDASRPVIRGMAFDRVRTRLFVRPGYNDVRAFTAERAGRTAQGAFVYIHDRDQHALRRVDFDVESDFDPAEPARALFGEAGTSFTAPFHFDEAPKMRLTGRVDGPAAPAGPHRRVHVDLASNGGFAYHGFALESLRCNADVNDDDVRLKNMEAGLAGGAATGEAHVEGAAEARTVAFDANLNGANLGRFLGVVEASQPAQEASVAPPAKSRFLERAAACRLDLSLKAKGNFGDFLSYHGEGNFNVTGHDLVDIPMLNQLFELLSTVLLNYKSQRLDNAQAGFQVEGRKLVFPDFKLTGPSAMIEAKGEYLLDTRTLDFNARIFPFKKQNFVLKTLVGAILSPLSNALEVRLAGQPENPSWSLTFLRGLARPPAGEQAAPGAEEGKPPAMQILPADAADPAPSANDATPAAP